ncbi:uncharacterized protein LOC131156366 [Malania oleifera]|uniref:uncharacterized protein LOC131156366 n=1 Tax=Malania oleifera TaxID=397392 RepID=UPI0025AE3D25|nr:uncharacterized protein LOC131156366 [Malania oleifera]
MGKVVEKKKKKKGRPSLLDLQKRSLRQQQQQQEENLHTNNKPNSNPYSNPNYRATSLSSRRSTRRNPNPDPPDPHDAEDDDESTGGKRREKKLKFVLRLQRSSTNSASLNSGSGASDSNPEEEVAATNHKKRKINAIGGGSDHGNTEKGEKPIHGTNPTSTHQGTQLDSGPSTPLPDKKLLVFVLDRLQKKDTYGVFSEPVDPKELPDYHDVIEHPMDFATVRKKLSGGAYANLEQFEKDIFLICSNAMQYNAPDTIYFRQARSIQELAKKNFENLRQDSDDNEPEQEPKIVRRGRPPTKNLKKPLGRPALERVGSEFSSDTTLATGGENSSLPHYDLRKGPLLDKSGPADSSGRGFHGSRNSDAFTNWLAEQKSERHDDFTGSMLKGNLVKHGKKQLVLDENRRNTYKQYLPSAGGPESSVLTTFDGEKKQLMAVGLHSEFGYARSLGRFAASLGPVAWKIASKKIERSLPAGVKFGPGWVGESEAMPQRLPPLPSAPLVQPSPSQPGNSYSSTQTSTVESKGNESLEGLEGDESSKNDMPSTLPVPDGHSSKVFPSSAAAPSTPIVGHRPSNLSAESEEAVRGFNSYAGLNVGSARPWPPSQIHQMNPVVRPGMNGFNGTFGFNFPAQMGKLIGAARPPGFNLQSSPTPDMMSRTNSNPVHVMTAANGLSSQEPNLPETSSTINSSSSLPNSGREGFTAQRAGFHPRPSWQGSSTQQKPDSVPPDLNVIFQSQGSPSSSRVDSTHPDLALQL